MMDFANIRIQLVDTPPILAGSCDPELAQLLHRADLALLVLSAADPDVLEQVEVVEKELGAHHVQLVEDPEHAEEVRVVGGAVRSVVVVTGTDREGGPEGLALLRELIGTRLAVVVVTPTDAEALEALRWEVWRRLGAVRVFTKEPGKKPDLGDPFYLSAGQTVLDLAFRIHKDVGRNLAFARLWGEGVHDGQNVHRDHVLHDGDIVELHT
jgi:ribosome-interacting GTPase 1